LRVRELRPTSRSDETGVDARRGTEVRDTAVRADPRTSKDYDILGRSKEREEV
jgi:hypothetical protein